MILGGIAITFGLTLWMLAVSGFIELRQAFRTETSWIGDQHLILSKPLRTTEALLDLPSGFTERELTQLETQPGIEAWAPFRNNRFQAALGPGTLGRSGSNTFASLVFLESIPREFLTEVPSHWKWTPESPYVPLLLPNEFLSLYNHAFAPGQGLPRVTPAMLGMATLELEAIGPAERRTFPVRVVGLTRDIPSILVPETFLQWANRHFSDRGSTEPRPTRIIVRTTGTDERQLDDWIADQSWEITSGRTSGGRLQAVGSLFMISLGIAGILILIPALSASVTTLLLMMERAAPLLRSLHLIGCRIQPLLGFYRKRMFAILALAWIIGFLALFFAHQWWASEAIYLGIESPAIPSIWSLLLSGTLPVILGLIVSTILKKGIEAKLRPG